MSKEATGLRSEIDRIRKVSDMLCTAHAGLRDHYANLALILDLGILGLSVWLTAMAFVSPALGLSLVPFALQPQIWIGVLSALTLFLAIVQLKTDWKAKSDAHRQALNTYAEVKREAGYALAAESGDEHAFQRVLARYDMASAVSISVPERHFLVLKRRHKLKVAVSKHLDAHPAASPGLVKLRLWLRDNITGAKNG